MMSTVQKNIDRIGLLTWGYVRNIEIIHKALNIPTPINDIIYLYLRMYDEWSEQYKSKDISIDDKTSIITFDSDDDSTIYGTQIIKDGIFKWRLKLISFRSTSQASPYVGIIENNPNYLKMYSDDNNWDDYGYQLCGGSGRLYEYGFTNPDRWSTRSKWRKDGDVLEMTLDLNEHTLSFKVNDTDFGALFSNVKDKEYRLSLSLLRSEGSQLRLI